MKPAIALIRKSCEHNPQYLAISYEKNVPQKGQPVQSGCLHFEQKNAISENPPSVNSTNSYICTFEHSGLIHRAKRIMTNIFAHHIVNTESRRVG
jgi:hypothetical protein